MVFDLLNGGMCYSNAKDSLTAAIERKNEELSDRLVNILRTKLRAHYEPTLDEIDVKYDRIFGSKDIDYGDYDVVFYPITYLSPQNYETTKSCV